MSKRNRNKNQNKAKKQNQNQNKDKDKLKVNNNINSKLNQNNSSYKNYLLIGIIIFLCVVFIFLLIMIFDNGNDNNDTNNSNRNNSIDNPNNSMIEFNQCLADNGVVIYGSVWCSACKNLVSTLGGYDAVEPVYVECTQEEQRCQNEAKSGYVPEIQINGEQYEGSRTLESFSEITGCQLPN